MKVYVNGVPLLGMEMDGQCSSRYPFNHLLLGSGAATVRYEAWPLKGEAQFHEDAYLKCEVELYDMNTTDYQPLSVMASYETPQQGDVVPPCFIHEDTFQVNVPYALSGWKSSVKLDRFEDQLRPMVFRKYNSIIAMMRNRAFQQYETAFREREAIMGACYYMTDDEKRERMKSLEDTIMHCTEIVPLSSRDVLELAAGGRLVRLVKDDGESALRVRNDLEEEETMIELWLHMKPGSTDLTII